MVNHNNRRCSDCDLQRLSFKFSKSYLLWDASVIKNQNEHALSPHDSSQDPLNCVK